MEIQRIRAMKDGDLLLIMLAADMTLEEKAVLYREKMRRNLIWNLRRLG